MKYIRQACVIFGITMIGEFLNYALPLPIPGGVYGLFLMLIALCTGVIKLSDVEETANFLLDTMSIMFVPATVGLIEHVDLLKAVIIPFSIIWFGVTFFGMIAPLKGVWEIKVEEDNITVIKMFIFRRYWKISDISYCKMKRGGMNVYVNGRKKKAFFVDGMTDHFDNFIKRMEKEGKEIIIPEPKEKN